MLSFHNQFMWTSWSTSCPTRFVMDISSDRSTNENNVSHDTALQRESVDDGGAFVPHTLRRETHSDEQCEKLARSRDDNWRQKRHRITFPRILHKMLEDVERCGKCNIVGWQPDGLSFKVSKPQEFVQSIMPHYFKHSNIRSFKRQVSNSEKTV